MNFSPPSQSFANDSMKLKSMKKKGGKLRPRKLKEREKRDEMEAQGRKHPDNYGRKKDRKNSNKDQK